MLRVSSNNVLVVPPFECAWLSFSDYNLDGGACLSFEVKGAIGQSRYGPIPASSALGGMPCHAENRAPSRPMRPLPAFLYLTPTPMPATRS